MEDIIIKAINEKYTLTMNYMGNERHVQPVSIGVLKNGKPSLLCYKIDPDKDGENILSVRIYHLEKAADVCLGGPAVAYDTRVNYFLSRHFKTVKAGIQPL